MNNQRRKEIEQVIKDLDKISSQIDGIQDEEQDYLDNIPENLQDSDRYYAAEEVVDNLGLAKDSIDEAVDYLREAGE